MRTQRRRHSTPDRASAHPVWRLHGATEKVVECSVTLTVSSLYAVTVVFGSETFLHECYPDATSAMSRAKQVQQRLLESGSWTAIATSGESLQ